MYQDRRFSVQLCVLTYPKLYLVSIVPAYLDDITNLQDPGIFHHKITEELNARTPYGTTKNGREVRSDPSYVASVIAIRYVVILPKAHLVLCQPGFTIRT